MRIRILTNDKVASTSHREQQQYIDVSPTDTIANVKVKCSMIYETLDINEYDLTYNRQKLKD